MKRSKVLRSVLCTILFILITNLSYSVILQDGRFIIKKNEVHAETSNGWLYFLKNYSIYKMRPDGTGLTEIYHDSSNEVRGIQVTPDAQMVYFIKLKRIGDSYNYSVYKIKSDGTNLQMIGSRGYGDYYNLIDQIKFPEIKISPDEQWVYYIQMSSDYYGGGAYLFRIKSDGTQSSVQVTSNYLLPANFSISPDQGWTYFSDGGRILKQNNYYNNIKYQIYYSSGTTEALEGSSDGQWIYFCDFKSGTNRIFRVKTDGTNALIIFTHNGYDYSVTSIKISPDLEWIYFEEEFDNGYYQKDCIYRMKPDGTSLSLLYDSGYGYDIKEFALSHDGQKIYFSKNNSNGYIYKMNVDGTSLTQIYYGSSSPISSLTTSINNNCTINSTNPVYTNIFSESSTSFAPSITVQDVDNDNLTCQYFIDSETTAQDTKTATGTSTAKTVTFNAMNMAALAEGNHTIKFKVNDGFATTEKIVSFKVDKSPPTLGTITVTSTTSSITITGSAADSISELDNNPYRYTVGSSVTSWLPISSSPYTKSSLTPNTSYSVKFEARDDKGHIGTYTGSIYTKAVVPSVAVNTPTSSSLKVTVSDSNPSSTQYQLKTGSYYVTQSGTLSTSAQWITLSSKNITVTELSPNTSYSFTARAKNGQGVATSFSASASGTTLYAAPETPEIISTHSETYSITVNWSAEANATSYTIKVDGNQQHTVTGCTFVHSEISPGVSLLPGTEYTYQVLALNNGVPSGWSPETVAWTLPYPPDGLSATSTNADIAISWNSANGATGYTIEIDNNSQQRYDVGLNTAFTHSDLQPNSAHTYRVITKGISGDSTPSISLTKCTLANIPSTGSIGIITGTSIQASWGANGNPQGTQYTLAAFTSDNVLFKQNAWSTALDDTITGLSPETIYRIKVLAQNNDIEPEPTAWYEIGSAQTQPSPPEAPQNFSATSTETEIELSWDEVENATSYEIYKDNVLLSGNATSPYIDSGLTPGTQHKYIVQAKRYEVPGEPSSELVISTKLPVPQNITAWADSNSITISWDAVGDASVYKLEIDSLPDLEIISSGTQYTHTGLTPYSTHTYRIMAENSVSSSDWSGEVVKMTKATPPAAPTGLSSEESSTWIRIIWSPVSGASGYEIKADDSVISVGQDTQYLGMGLAAGTEHTYQVRARNSAGKSDWSSPYAVSTESISPDIPSGLIALVTDTSIEVTWDDVTGASGYIIEVDDENISVTDAIYGHTGLAPGSEHSYRVCSDIAGNLSNWSEMLTVRTLDDPDSLPTIPQNILYTASQTEILLGWDRVNGALSYDIELNGSLIDSTPSKSYEVDGLSPGGNYTFRIRAVNQNGPGDWSGYINTFTSGQQSGVPAVPQNITWLSTKNSVTLIWDYTDNADSFDVEMDGQLMDNVSVSAYVYRGLPGNSVHSFRVRGVNSDGPGDWSSVIEASTLPEAPGIPQNITLSSSQTSVTLAWNAVVGASIYEIEADGNVISDIVDTTYTHQSLNPGTQHTYRVRARNVGGTSDWSSQKTILTTTGTAGVPENLNISTTDTSVTLTWDEVSGVDSYEVEIDCSSTQSVTEAVYNHQGVTHGTLHSYRVRSVTAGNPGSWSAQVSISTMLSVPLNLTTVSGESQVILTWDAVQGAVDYELQIDGETVIAVQETSYTHTNLMPGSEHTYRLRARGSGITSPWTEPVTQRAQNLAYTSNYSSGEIFEIVFAAQNVSDFSQRSFIIEYNPAELEVLDLCAVTPLEDPEEDFEEGLIQGTDIYLESFTDGAVRFKANKAVAPGQVWSGIVNRIRFMAKTSGDLTITYAIN